MIAGPNRRAAVVVLLAALCSPAAAGAHGDAADSRVAQDPVLLSALVALGGGPAHFSAAAFRRALCEAKPGEEEALRTAMSSAAVDRFDAAFTFVVNDGLATMGRAGKALPAPGTTDAKAVAGRLYRAGLRDGHFDVEHLFDTLFSPEVHGHAMVAVGRRYGPDGESAYHGVFARLVSDVGNS